MVKGAMRMTKILTETERKRQEELPTALKNIAVGREHSGFAV